ncbi:ATP-binding protein [Erwinia rhapontici]|uniref:ATP-binding protein n=1 Tax=Erwinia rhapontici TaxID=55212 RepID=UPI002167A7BC|nr:transporter substrate-binding domain-containing protein [Erwinia rhapontici]
MAVAPVIARPLLLILLLFVSSVSASLRPISSIALPQEMMPLASPASESLKNLRIGVLVGGSSPWNMVVGNDLYGINADYLVALQQTSGLSMNVQGFNRLPDMLEALQQRKVDVLFGVPQHPLPPGISATQPWFSSPLRIYRNRNNLRPVMFNSSEARISVSRDTLARVNPAFVQQHRWQIVDSDVQALSGLLNQHSDYVVADETSAGFLLGQLQQGEIYQLASPLDPGMLQIRAVTRSPALTQQLDDAIRQLPMEVVNGIQARWSSALPRYQDSNTARLTPMERSWIAEHPMIIYAAVSDDYPWSYRNASGQPAGYSVDLLNSIGQLTGLRFQPYWVSNAQQAGTLVTQGRALIQLTLPLTGNDAMLNNTQPVWRALWGVYVRPSEQSISSWADLNGKRIGVKRGDIASRLLPAGTEPQVFDDTTRLYDALASGQIDALVDNVLSARWRIQSRYVNTLQLAFTASDTAWPITLGIAPDQPLLRALLNNSLQQIPAESWQRLRENWGSTPESVDDGHQGAMRPISLFVLVAALFAIVFLLILLLRRYLDQRRERQQRQRLEQEREVALRENRMKSQFLATVSHELRTPMQAVLGLLELELVQQPQRHNLSLIYSSAASLLTLLNDLQDHARVESNSFNLVPRPLEPESWLKHLAVFYPPLIRRNGPQLNVSALTTLPDWVLIDGERLQQIANNLMGNAIKFTPQGEIHLTLAALEDPPRLCLRVTDTGSGIPLAEQQRLFEPWYQTPSGRQLSVQGSGLGLSICREIVSRMGGTIDLQSAPGEGTCVSVTLPWQVINPPQPVASQAGPVAAMTHHLRAAIIDDHPTNLLVMQQQLAHCGIQADTFGNGRALLDAAKQAQWDLLFIDFSMPHPDGLTLAKILRRRERHQPHRTRIVLCSADAHILNHPQAQQVADHLLLKPVSLADIATLLQADAPDLFADITQRLNQLAHNDVHYFQRLCQTLSETLARDVEAMNQAIAAEAWPVLESAAHRMKGSWLLLGYSEGERLCQQIIQSAKNHQPPKSALTLLISLSDKLLTQLESYGSQPR